AFRMGVFGGASDSESTSEPTGQALEVAEAKGPLAVFATGSMAKLVTYETPQKVEDISFGNRAREMIKLSDFKSQVVVLNVRSTRCTPCKDGKPTHAALQKQYTDKDLTVIPLRITTE